MPNSNKNTVFLVMLAKDVVVKVHMTLTLLLNPNLGKSFFSMLKLEINAFRWGF